MRLALLALVAGCYPPDIPGAIVTHSRHIELHADPSRPVCDGSLAHADAYLEATADFLGTPVPQVTYYLYATTFDGCRILPGEGEVYDCTADTTVFSQAWPHYHELVHAVAGPWGRPPAFLLEGLAEGLGSEDPLVWWNYRQTMTLPVDTVAFYASDAGAHYSLAADFAIYLLHRYDIATYRRLSKSMLYLADSNTIHQRFEAITGDSLDQVIADWQLGPSLGGGPLPHALAKCRADVLAPSAADAWSDGATTTCASEGMFRQAAFRTIDIATPGWYHLAGTVSDPASEATFTVDDCGSGDDLHEASRFTPTGPSMYPGPAWYGLGASRHAIGVDIERPMWPSADVDESWQIGWVAPFGATCETAAVIEPSSLPSYWDAVTSAETWPRTATGHPQTWLRVDSAPANIMATFFGGGASGRACSGTCDALVGCLTFGPDDDFGAAFWRPVAGAPMYIELDSEVSSAEYVLSLQMKDTNQNATPMRGPNANARSWPP
jgi:hypothetical protein